MEEWSESPNKANGQWEPTSSGCLPSVRIDIEKSIFCIQNELDLNNFYESLTLKITFLHI